MEKIKKFVRLVPPEPCGQCRAVSSENWGVQYTEERHDEEAGTMNFSHPTTIGGLSKLAAEMLFCKAILDGHDVRK